VHDVTREALWQHTTLRLGGPAARLVAPTETDEVLQTVREAEDLLIIAGGSNVVIADAGWPGTVVLLRTRGQKLAAVDSATAELTVAAGEPWDAVVRLAVDAGLSGLECLSGIPGSAGATPIQNVGAYGQEVAQRITAVRVFDRVEDRELAMGPAECGFGYRSSRFKHQDRWVVLEVTFRLDRSELSAPIGYAELARSLGVGLGDRVPLAAVRAAVLGLRAGKGMVLDPADPDTSSVGSFFMNPVLTAAEFEALCARSGTTPTAWPAGSSTKVSAAWLIEHAGFGKGYSGGHPGVSLSTKHTLALTNRGTGTTAALLGLARDVRDGVRKAFDVELRPEPVLVNCQL
jgi:UDP-N-acetylmuramate dehydrogenase